MADMPVPPDSSAPRLAADVGRRTRRQSRTLVGQSIPSTALTALRAELFEKLIGRGPMTPQQETLLDSVLTTVVRLERLDAQLLSAPALLAPPAEWLARVRHRQRLADAVVDGLIALKRRQAPDASPSEFQALVAQVVKERDLRERKEQEQIAQQKPREQQNQEPIAPDAVTASPDVQRDAAVPDLEEVMRQVVAKREERLRQEGKEFD